MYMCVCIYMYMCVYIYVCIYILYVYICTYVYMCICVHIYICIYIVYMSGARAKFDYTCIWFKNLLIPIYKCTLYIFKFVYII